MRKIILYIAVSIDGYIAGPDGEIDWLHSIDNPDNNDFGYAKFYKSIDTTIMGNSTYKQILSFGVDFPYPEKTNYVFTKNNSESDTDDVKFVNSDFEKFVIDLKNSSGKNIWLIGGGKTNSFFLNNNFIDEIILTTIPIILGKGILLFDGKVKPYDIEINRLKNYKNGIVQTVFFLKNEIEDRGYRIFP
jgi:dihydrofolate reductase